MGPLTVRNLTYLAVGLCVFALIYLIRQSMLKKDQERSAIASETGGLKEIGDSSAVAAVNQSLGGGSPATDERLGAGGAASTAAAPSSLVKPTTPTSASTTTVRTAPSGGGSSASSTVAEVSPQNHTKQTLTSKGGAKTTPSDTKTYTTAGDKGDFWVIAGSFKDAAGANARVADLKKKGFAYASAVKDETSGNMRVVAAKFPFNGGAEAEVRNLKKHDIDAFITKH
jgi:cell division septation protein DedD